MRIYRAKAVHFHYMKDIRGTYKWTLRRASIRYQYLIRNIKNSIAEIDLAIRKIKNL